MKVLIVEDYGPLRLALRGRLLEAGLQVDDTADGERALEMFFESTYNLVVLDLMLPGRSGIDLLREIRKVDSDTAVIIVTARDELSDRVAGLDMGADDYLVKPFALEEAAARIRALLRRQFGQHQAKIRIDDLEIDLGGHVALRGGKPLALTAREFGLLRLLALRKGRILSRAEIWEEIYDSSPDDSASNVVTVTMSRLRKKVNARDKKTLIHTVRGLGYVLQSGSYEE